MIRERASPSSMRGRGASREWRYLSERFRLRGCCGCREATSSAWTSRVRDWMGERFERWMMIFTVYTRCLLSSTVVECQGVEVGPRRTARGVSECASGGSDCDWFSLSEASPTYRPGLLDVVSTDPASFRTARENARISVSALSERVCLL